MKRTSRSEKIFWIYFVSVLLLVTLPINSAGEFNDIIILRFRGDYFLHALIFVPWMLFRRAVKIKWWLWLLFGVLFAAGCEVIQYVLPYRTFNVNDLVANIIGIMVGTGIVRIAQQSTPPSLKLRRSKGAKAQRF